MPLSKKRKSTRQLTVEEELEAANLESFLFQKNDDALTELGEEAKHPIDTLLTVEEDVLGGYAVKAASGMEEQRLPVDIENSSLRKGKGRKPVWQDPDDEGVQINVANVSRLRKLRESESEAVLTGTEYQERLREQHKKLHPRVKWASLEREKESRELSEAEKLLVRAGGLLSSSHALPPERIEMTRLKDANFEEPNQSVVQSVEFHPNGQLLMTAGLDRRLRFFSVDGITNPHIQSIFLEDSPVQQAAFTSGGAQIVATGRRPFFYMVDLESAAIERVSGIFSRKERSFESFATSTAASIIAFFGRDGSIPLVSTSSRQAVGTLKMNGTVRSGSFSPNGNELLTSGGDGLIYVWDLRMQRCLRRYIDEGSTGTTALATAPNGQMFASGSKSGIVNLYNHPPQNDMDGFTRSSLSRAPELPLALKPLKALPNLVTTADTLSFNHDGQLLAIASRLKRDALKLIHVPTMTAFSNWPTSRSPIHYVHSLAFSPSGGYLAIGNARGRVLLYRIHHYSQI